MREAFFIGVCTLGESLNLTRCINALLEISENSSENIQIAVIINNKRSELVK